MPMSLAHAESIIERGHAMIARPQGLGIMVSAPENAVHCPAGWLFIPNEALTAEKLIGWANEFAGREGWPRSAKKD